MFTDLVWSRKSSGSTWVARDCWLKKINSSRGPQLMLSSSEIWGGTSSSHSLASFFKSFFQSNKLIDIVPEKLFPTWRNNRSGTEYISKRLYRTFISEDLLVSVGIYKSWVEYPFISDHAPIILQRELPPLFKAYPFKLNPLWILDRSLILLAIIFEIIL